MPSFEPTRPAALARLATVQPGEYARTRNALDGAVTRLSPYLTHGLLSLPEVFAAVHVRHPLDARHKLVFELGWRAYYRHVWAHLGDGIQQSLHAGLLPEEAYQTGMPADVLEARTGVAAIDLAVRELYATGYLHNHARMWLASYVVHLRKVHWHTAAQWMLAHLLDGDVASNHLSWQWVAGTGSSKPYLFNADNVAKYAPAPWHSPGTVIDTSYEALDRMARSSTAANPRLDHHRAEAGLPQPEVMVAPADDRWSAPEPTAVAGRDVWLLHPWSLGATPQGMGADAVVMQEDCVVQDDGRVRVQTAAQPGQWIRRSGEDVMRGAVVLPQGTRLNPAALGLAASIGMAQLPVARRPRVALFSTGDELVMPGQVAPQDMAPGAIYNSNRFFLKALLTRLGCEVSDLGIVPDDRAATVQALREAAHTHDLILTSGGVSVGEEDHIKPAVQSLGSLDLWQIAIKPGKPFAHGRVLDAHFIGLPGNPVSSYVTFLLLVRPFLLKLQGMSNSAPASRSCRADFSWPRADKRREFLRVRLNADGDLELFANQSSGVLTSAVWGDGLVDNPPGQTIAPGDAVRFISFAELLA